MDSVGRSEPALDAAERPMLEGWLDYHDETLAVSRAPRPVRAGAPC